MSSTLIKFVYNIPKKYVDKLTSFKIIDTYPNNNELFNKFSMTIQNMFKSHYDLPKLHRWCNTTSPIYKDICDWEKKTENAGRDNCYSNNLR